MSVKSTLGLLVGAGFNLAANDAGDVDSSCREYPLIAELGAACFGPEDDLSNGVEAAFSEAALRKDPRPIGRLVELLEAADYYFGTPLARAGGGSYLKCFERFLGAPIFSFNYDSLVELILFHAGKWTPADGFGVPVRFTTHPVAVARRPLPEKSSHQIYHLHGSIYLYASEFELSQSTGHAVQWLNARRHVEFRFDPDALGQSFFPVERAPPDLSYLRPDERLIVPVPDKTNALAERWTQTVYSAAVEVARELELLVAVGYRFSPCDAPSYSPILSALTFGSRRRSVIIVSPDANESRDRLASEYPSIEFVARPYRFTDWARRGFPLA